MPDLRGNVRMPDLRGNVRMPDLRGRIFILLSAILFLIPYQQILATRHLD
jgi:hypothetical protein